MTTRISTATTVASEFLSGILVFTLTGLLVPIFLLLFIPTTTHAWWWESGFTDADINAMTKSIKEEFDKREGVKVIEVKMLKESSKKAFGFVKLQVPLFGEITKSCSATMAETGSRYIWQCL